MEYLYIRMFGEFSLQAGNVRISDHNNRSKKVWLLLAYLITHKKQVVPRRELLNLLWKEDSSGSSPENSLKAILYRARTLLNELWPSAGYQLILYTKDGYKWNTEIPATVDLDEFETLCGRADQSDEERINCLLDAQALYRGDCLSRFSSESWVISLTTYYHNLYVRAMLDLIPMLAARGRHKEVVSVCKETLMTESCHEPLHQYLMEALIAQGDYGETIAVYEKLSEKLFEESGIHPRSETVALYRTALQTMKNEHLSMEDVLEYLQESHAKGALECDFDYFKVLSHAEARAMRRSGIETHIVLLTVDGAAGKELSRRSIDRAMENLGEQLRLTLRQSDTFSRCSITQYALLLPQTNYENSGMVCRRIIKAYTKRYPNSPVNISFTVRVLVPEAQMFRWQNREQDLSQK